MMVLSTVYYDYPLEQGLRRNNTISSIQHLFVYYDYPLEQGLRHRSEAQSCPLPLSIMIIH